jgi:eukaryotic-like serine/threonine-protein kinase
MNTTESEPDLLVAIAEEFADRYRRGERPALSEYTDKHPDLAERIRELFPAMVMMEELGSVDGAASPLSPRSAPERLGEYRILREVGRGGMGVVYEAVQESLGRHVALKVLPMHATREGNQQERFRREAKAAALLHHSNIVPVFGIGEHDGTLYYAMQFIQGQGLDMVLGEIRRLRQHPSAAADLQSAATSLQSQPEAQYFRSVSDIGAQVAEALAYAHQQGMFHRDIKPSNLLLDAKGTVWVADFGLVKAEGSDELTGTGDIVGTVRYMAPERFQGKCDARSDIYALGVTLYELLALRPAFAESDRNKLIHQVTQSEPVRLRRLQRSVPRDLETIVHKAMERQPGHRYATAGELAADLRCFREDRPITARRIGGLERTWRWCRRNPAVALLTTSVAMLVIAAVAALAVSNIRISWEKEQTANALKDKGKALEEKDNALATAIASRRQAEEHLQLVLKALDAVYLTEVENRLAVDLKDTSDFSPPDPEKQQRERDFLEKGVRFYTELAKRESLDPEARFATAKAYRRVAWMQMSLRQFDKSEAALQKAIALLEELTERAPSSAEYHLELADTYHWLFKPLSETNRLSEAEKVTRQALTQFEKLSRRFPDETRAQEGLVDCYHNLGTLLPKINRPVEAKHAYERALAINRELATSFPGQMRYRQLQTVIQDQLAELLDQRITVRNAGKLPELKRLPEDVYDIVWAPDGRKVAFVRYGHAVNVLDSKTFKPRRTLGVDRQIMSFAFGRDPAIIVLSEQLDEPPAFDSKHPPFGRYKLRSEILNLSSGEAVHVDGGGFVRVSPDGTRLATQGYANSARIWSMPDGKLLHDLDVETEGGITPEFSPDGKVLAVGNRNGYTCLFDVATGKRLQTLFRAMSHGLKFHPDGKTLAVTYVDGSLGLWNVADGKLLCLAPPDSEWKKDARRSPGPPWRDLHTVDWSINGDVLATGGRDTTITLWKARDLSPLKKLEAGNWIIKVRFSPDGSRLWSAGGDDGPNGSRSVRVWGLPESEIEEAR